MYNGKAYGRISSDGSSVDSVDISSSKAFVDMLSSISAWHPVLSLHRKKCTESTRRPNFYNYKRFTINAYYIRRKLRTEWKSTLRTAGLNASPWEEEFSAKRFSFRAKWGRDLRFIPLHPASCASMGKKFLRFFFLLSVFTVVYRFYLQSKFLHILK